MADEEIKKPNDALPLSELQSAIKNDLLKHAAGRAKQCARNAIRHLEKAWEIRSVDKEMAAFRAITAEEEASTAIFLTLKKRHYPHADLIKHYEHPVKASLYPFLCAVAEMLIIFNHGNPQIVMNKEVTPPKLSVRVNMKKLAGAPDADTDPLYGSPVPPLHWSAKNDKGELIDFTAELIKRAEAGGFKKIIDFVRNEANTRNRLLYASDQGVPVVEYTDALLIRRKDRVFGMLVLYLLIDQYPEQQLFVVQCLQAFLKIHTKFEPDLSAFAKADEEAASAPNRLEIMATKNDPTGENP